MGGTASSDDTMSLCSVEYKIPGQYWNALLDPQFHQDTACGEKV